MKIVFWNCNDGFQKKYSKLDEISADLYIVAECRDINNDKFTTFRETHKNIMYLKQDGDIKGLLIYSNKDKFTKQDWNDYNMDYYLPICFQDKKILCVWTKHGYIEDLCTYTQLHMNNLKDTIIIGDFNSSVIWDKKHGRRTHSFFNHLMNGVNHISAYHTQTGEQFGKETQPTFFLHRNELQPYHIDYSYVPENDGYHLEIGNRDFLDYSDHLPLILDINNDLKD